MFIKKILKKNATGAERNNICTDIHQYKDDDDHHIAEFKYDNNDDDYLSNV